MILIKGHLDVFELMASQLIFTSVNRLSFCSNLDCHGDMMTFKIALISLRFSRAVSSLTNEVVIVI